MNHIMLDLETFGLKPGSLIRSIAAVPFDPVKQTIAPSASIFSATIDPNSCPALVVDPNTVLWWLSQEKAAQEKLLGDSRSLTKVASDFRWFWNRNSIHYVWCHGASFDVVMWEAAIRTVGETPPWTYKQVRDTRTIYDLAGIDLAAISEGTHHDPVVDCLNQIKGVCQAYERLGLLGEWRR